MTLYITKTGCLYRNHLSVHYNYLQLLCREIMEFYFTEGFPRPIARDILQAKLVEGARGKVKFLISRKSCCTQFYRLLEYLVKYVWKIRKCFMTNPRKSWGPAGGNLTYYPHGTKSNITTLWRHQTVVKEREIKVNNFHQKAVKIISAPISFSN